jgi:hypothetical protein
MVAEVSGCTCGARVAPQAKLMAVWLWAASGVAQRTRAAGMVRFRFIGFEPLDE